MTDALVRERRGDIDILTLNRPERRNALSAAMARALVDTFAELAQEPDGPPAVLAGAGDSAFCAGVDLKEFTELGANISAFDPLRTLLRKPLPRLVVTAVNGAALGAGLELVLAADLVIAAEHATFGIPEVRRGLIAGMGGLVMLPSRLPHALALEMAVTGYPITAQQALAAGLVNRVVPAQDVVPEATALAQRIADNPATAVLHSRRVVRHAALLTETDAWRVNDESLSAVLSSPDALEGPRAFTEGRTASWAGRATTGADAATT